MQVTIKRTFENKNFGTIGEVTLKADVAKIELEGVELPIGSVEYLLTFALQSLQDAYAGAKSEAEAKANFAKKLERVQKDEIGTRTGGGIGEEQRVARVVVRELINAGKLKITKDEFAKLDDKAKDAKLDEIIGKNAEKLSPIVAKRIEKAKKEREERRKQANELELDI